jgi:hypothetical protein
MLAYLGVREASFALKATERRLSHSISRPEAVAFGLKWAAFH